MYSKAIGVKVSIFSLVCILFFLVLQLLARFIFPAGDEPDWNYRTEIILNGEYSILSAYNLFESYFPILNTDYDRCGLVSSVFSIWSYVPPTCNESLEQVLLRFSVTALSFLPILLVLAFSELEKSSSKIVSGYSDFYSVHKKDALFLAILFPGMLFYSGVFAEEQTYLVFSLLLFIFINNPLFLLALVFLLMTIDIGNALVAIFFLCSIKLFGAIRFNLGRLAFFVLISVLLLVVYIFGLKVLMLFQALDVFGFFDGVTDKADAIIELLEDSDLVTKYPVFLRPFITFMTLVFMTPSGVKVVYLYPIYGFFFLYFSFKVIREKDPLLDVFWFVPIFVVLFFVFILPTYSNAKYYTFLLPFWLCCVLYFSNRVRVLLVFLLTTVFVFASLVLYRF